MRIKVLSIQSSKEPWFEKACALYDKKISAFCKFENIHMKAKSLDRKQREQKKLLESKLILEKIRPQDFVILCDERGKSFTSQEFSKKIVSCFEGGYSDIVFVIGGAYGCSEELQERAKLKWSLSNMVMNHLVAQTVVLEQIYRAFAIWKGLPYHNE